MKKLLLGIITMMMWSTVSFAQTKTPTPTAQRIHIELGRKSKNCEGFGICVFTVDISFQELLDFFNGLKTADNQIKISFSKDFYEKNKSKFSNNQLVLEEDFQIDSKTSNALGFKDNYTIKKGKYPIVLDQKSNTYNCTL